MAIKIWAETLNSASVVCSILCGPSIAPRGEIEAKGRSDQELGVVSGYPGFPLLFVVSFLFPACIPGKNRNKIADAMRFVITLLTPNF